MDNIMVELYHGGRLRFAPEMNYIGGKVKIYKTYDPDYLSVTHMYKTTADMGYNNVIDFYYKFLGEDFELGLKCFSKDKDVLRLFELLNKGGHNVLQIYVYHAFATDESQIIDEMPLAQAEPEPVFMIPLPLEYVEKSPTHVGGKSPTHEGSPRLRDVPLEEVNVCDYEESNLSDNSRSSLSDFVDSDEEEKEDIFDIEKEKEIEAKVKKFMNGQSSNQPLDVEWDGDCESEYDDSDDLKSLDGSSDEENGTKYPEFNENTDMSKPIKLVKGLKFVSHVVFRKALKEWTISHGYDYRYIHNDKWRVTAECTKKCGWRIHASPTQMADAFQIKTYKPKHNCGRHYHNTKVTAAWLAVKYVPFIRDDPTWPVDALREAVKRQYNVFVSNEKCYRAKVKALKIVHGSEDEQYEKLWNYCAAIRKYNLGTSMKVQKYGNMFLRLYVCLHLCKEGFLKACRPIIGIDGCHLKGRLGGQLLCAIGKDANDNMFPIAYAVVEGETKESWTSFLTCLLDDIGWGNWTFVSDQQKGLVEAFKDIMPNADHRFCVRHLYANFKKLHKGKVLKDIMWNAARSTTKRDFERHMKHMEDLDPAAAFWLKKHEPPVWSRHAQNPKVKCDMLLNNISECFNSYIKEARDKPIITMLEMIRRMLMKRFHGKKVGMRDLNVTLCPRIQAKLDKIKSEAMNCIARVGGEKTFEVEHCFGGQYVVDLNLSTCTCRKWDLIGIPCCHAAAAIFLDRGRPESYVDSCYSKETFLQAYEKPINPVPGEDEWPQCNFNPISPPVVRRQPGRPRKARRREEDEDPNPYQISRQGATLKCGNCKQWGHNARTCKAPVNSNRRTYKPKKNKTAIAVGQQGDIGQTSQGTKKRKGRQEGKATEQGQEGGNSMRPKLQVRKKTTTRQPSQATRQPSQATWQPSQGTGQASQSQRQPVQASQSQATQAQAKAKGKKKQYKKPVVGLGIYNGKFM